MPRLLVTRLLSNLRPTTRDCVHLVTRGHFRSRDKDGVLPYPKRHATHRVHGFMFCETGVIADRSFTLREYGFSTFVAPVTLTLTRRPSCTNLTRISSICTGRANMNFLRQGLQQLSSDRQTERQTDRQNRNYIPRRL